MVYDPRWARYVEDLREIFGTAIVYEPDPGAKSRFSIPDHQ
jgi:hypothetical protein